MPVTVDIGESETAELGDLKMKMKCETYPVLTFSTGGFRFSCRVSVTVVGFSFEIIKTLCFHHTEFGERKFKTVFLTTNQH